MTIAATKADLTAALKTAVGVKPTVRGYIPTQINTREAVFLAPAENYVTPGETFGGDVRLIVHAYVLVTVTTNKADDLALDALLEKAWPPLANWEVLNTDQPDVYKFGEWAMYGTRITLSTTTPIGDSPA